jgi:hypothetical protein
MPKNTSKSHVLIMAGLIMLLLITTDAKAKDPLPTSVHQYSNPFYLPQPVSFPTPYDANKASITKRGICCLTKCALSRNYVGVTRKEYFRFVRSCCKQFCVPGIWLW